MRLILILTLLTTSAFAQKLRLEEMIDVIARPEALNDPICTADESSAKEAVNACQSLAGAVCAIRNNQKGLKELQARYGKRTFPTLAGIQTIERDVFDHSFVKHDDLVILFEEVRTSMLDLISKNTALTFSQSEAMKNKIRSVQFMSGPEYIHNRGEEKGLKNYNENCGNGTEVSAFNQQDKVVLCPGLIQSLQDFGPKSKWEMLNSLSFTIGHELAHSIDSTSDRFPAPYERMHGCYDEFETRGPEISSDFWGAKIIAERLKADNITGRKALRLLALATDDFCSFPEDQYYPSGQSRLDVTIGRDPAIREVLGCGAPTKEAPVCTLAGPVPGVIPPSVATSK